VLKIKVGIRCKQCGQGAVGARIEAPEGVGLVDIPKTVQSSRHPDRTITTRQRRRAAAMCPLATITVTT